MANRLTAQHGAGKKKRLDVMLVEKGVTESRHQAEALILSGKVTANGILQTKPGTFLASDTRIDIASPPAFVGRGGLKLKHALQFFQIDPRDKICLDVGASTGGFSDCLLQQGAKRVYAVDVGRGQLAWKLRQDPRVISLEKVNARYLSQKEIPEKIDLTVVDVSFISVTKILPALKLLLEPDGECIVLIKPQFEAGAKKVRKGIVKDKLTHTEVLKNFIKWAVDHEFEPVNLCASPITGAKGNIEFFIQLKMGTVNSISELRDSPLESWGQVSQTVPQLESIVEEAHRKFGDSP